MKIFFFVGVLISLIPLITVGTFNGISLLGLIVVAFSVYRILKKEGLS